VPFWQLLYRKIWNRDCSLAPRVPFDFLRILLEDKYVERVERKKLAELIGERVRQFLKLPACRKGRL